MDNREKLYTGLSKAAWGYFLLVFDINFGNVSILPSFAGCFLLYSALAYLAEERRDLLLLRTPCLLLAVWNLAGWLLSWFGAALYGKFIFLDLLTAAAGLYFHFQFLTDMAALAEKLQEPDSKLDCQIRKRRTLYMVLTTLLQIVHCLPQLTPGITAGITFCLGLVYGIAAFLVMYALFRLRRCVPRENTP